MNKVGPIPSAGVVLSHGLKRYFEPLRLPPRAAVLSLPYTQRVVASPPPGMDLQHWAVNLQAHADPVTPGVDRRHFRSSSAHPTAFPFCPQGRLLQFVNEATHRFTCVTACALAVWKLTTPCCQDAAPSCYWGVRTTPQAGLEPARLTTVTANGQHLEPPSQEKVRPDLSARIVRPLLLRNSRSPSTQRPTAACAQETFPDIVFGVSGHVALTEVGPAATDTIETFPSLAAGLSNRSALCSCWTAAVGTERTF